MAKGITVVKPTSGQLKWLDVESWSPWSCEVSDFDWTYEGTETCYLLKGRVLIETGADTVEIQAGDLVQFDDGLQCRWKVTEPVRKVFSFEITDLNPKGKAGCGC